MTGGAIGDPQRAARGQSLGRLSNSTRSSAPAAYRDNAGGHRVRAVATKRRDARLPRRHALRVVTHDVGDRSRAEAGRDIPLMVAAASFDARSTSCRGSCRRGRRDLIRSSRRAQPEARPMRRRGHRSASARRTKYLPSGVSLVSSTFCRAVCQRCRARHDQRIGGRPSFLYAMSLPTEPAPLGGNVLVAEGSSSTRSEASRRARRRRRRPAGRRACPLIRSTRTAVPDAARHHAVDARGVADVDERVSVE